MEQEKKCADLVQQKFNETEADFKAVADFFEEYENATEGEQIALIAVYKHKGNYYHEYEDLFDYVNQTALCWDYVEAEGKNAGYYRLQLSWGGPSDECRIYSDIIEYWYMDWFDGACIEVPEDSYTYMICEMMYDCSEVA